MPLAHQFSLLTTTSNQRRDRGNISVLSVLWLAVAALASFAITHATSVLLQRANLQASADAVALACASRDAQAARIMAEFQHVDISSIEEVDNSVIVTVTTSAGSATAQALRSAYEFQP